MLHILLAFMLVPLAFSSELTQKLMGKYEAEGSCLDSTHFEAKEMDGSLVLVETDSPDSLVLFSSHLDRQYGSYDCSEWSPYPIMCRDKEWGNTLTTESQICYLINGPCDPWKFQSSLRLQWNGKVAFKQASGEKCLLVKKSAKPNSRAIHFR